MKNLSTEDVNPISNKIGEVTTEASLRTINKIDQDIAYCVETAVSSIAKAINNIFDHIKQGGRLIYLAGGASGMIAEADALEMPITYGVNFELIRSVTPDHGANQPKGSLGAIPKRSVEETDCQQAVVDLQKINLSAKDYLLGISASGGTPYVVAGLEYGQAIGCGVGVLTNNANTKMEAINPENLIITMTGPEAIVGSTRMKAGTAQKMVLNMISTVLMIKLHRTYNNLMTCIQPAGNAKMIARSLKIISAITKENNFEKCQDALLAADYNLNLAIIKIIKNCSIDDANVLYKANDYDLSNLINGWDKICK